MHRAVPEPLINSLRHLPGFDEPAFRQVHESDEQLTSVRLNPAKITAEKLPVIFPGITTSPVPWCPNGIYLSERPSFTFDPHFHAGAYYVQEASSMFLWSVLKQVCGDMATPKVLDLCAAPGGKSSLLAAYFTQGLIVANEVIKSRCSILTENITKWGSHNVVVTNNDPRDFNRLAGYFDVMLVDAPCSGSGLFRKDNEAIKEWSEDAVKLCSQRQQRILADAYPALKPGGILIYATCSYSPGEDEDIVRRMILEHAAESIRLEAPPGVIETFDAPANAYAYRFFPDKIMGEGFFIAAFKKTAGTYHETGMQPVPVVSKEEAAIAAQWLNNNKALSFIRQKNNIIAVEEAWLQDIALLQQHLYLRKASVCVGTIKGRDFIPDHELALSGLMNSGVQVLHVQKDQAIDYLRKKEIIAGDKIKGWAVVQYEQSRLGWIKALQNRINNYYPMEWRILKQ